jgi:hypothetical protein
MTQVNSGSAFGALARHVRVVLEQRQGMTEDRMTRVALLAALALSGPAAAQDIGGRYLVQGTGLNGSAYGGEAEISLTSDYTCRIVWNTGGQISEGICMRQDNVFAASYIIENRVGMVIYTVNGDGSMQGTWTVDGVNAVGTESLYRN